MGAKADLRKCTEAAATEIEATRRRIEYGAGALREKASAKELTRPVRERLSGTLGAGGEKVLEAFRDNPVPLTLAGIGIGWMMLKDLRGERAESAESGGRSADDEASGAMEHAAESVKGAAERISQKVSGAAEKMKEAVKERAGRTSDWFETTLNENPMLLAIGALAVGMVAGLGIPASPKEMETAGKVGEKLAEAALDKGVKAMEPTPSPSAPPAAGPEQAQAPAPGVPTSPEEGGGWGEGGGERAT